MAIHLMTIVEPPVEWFAVTYLPVGDDPEVWKADLDKRFPEMIYIGDTDGDPEPPWYEEAALWLIAHTDGRCVLTVGYDEESDDPVVLTAHFQSEADRDAFVVAVQDDDLTS